ncbi:uncharacterized protein LOC123516596 [Portunus trituberculatus]|uniref:uncharacterized protein LOC123516596 n=1 Tax=Portunus trituberculatus TaxID=210409 RepID=UPI001E1CFFAA|nr:uncharacterized protein LOC123516596 [Portunus trituberculatus]XP_045132057.1 uncharacterized protein LOC123516596 [Portunus trituberculatus]
MSPALLLLLLLRPSLSPGWCSLLVVGLACTTALSDQRQPPLIQRDISDATRHRDHPHWTPGTLSLKKEETEEIEYETGRGKRIQTELQMEAKKNEIDRRSERRASLFPILRRAPLMVQIPALLQLGISLGALGVSFIQVSKRLFNFKDDRYQKETNVTATKTFHATPRPRY